MTRRRATLLATFSVGMLGLLCTVSSDVFGIFNASPDLLLPFGGFFIVIFVGYFLGGRATKEELSSEGKFKVGYQKLFLFLVRFVAPLAIAFLFALGVYSRILSIFPSIG